MKQLSDLLTRSDISSCTAFYLSDKQAQKINISEEDIEMKAYYLNKFIEDLMSLFVWENLPDDIPSWIVEYLLLSVGRCLMFYDENVGINPNGIEESPRFRIMRYALTSFNDYYQPMTVSTISISTYGTKTQPMLDFSQFEYCWNNNTGVPLFNTAYTLADKLYHIDKTINYIQRQMRRPTIFSATKQAGETLNRLMNEQDPKTWYVVSKDIQSSNLIGTPLTNINIGQGLDILIKLRSMYLQEWDTRVALHSITMEKAARRTEFEAEGFSEMANINIAGMYTQRQRFCDLCNKHWGLNISCRYNEVIKTRGEEPITSEEGEIDEAN